MITDISPRVRNVLVFFGALGFVLVLGGYVTGAQWFDFLLQLFGFVRT